MDEFRRKYRECAALLVDDVQFLAGKDKTAEEFFHTFNELHDHHVQIVLSSDRSPKELKGLDDRLCSRFEWGMRVQIEPPEFETRAAILRRRRRSSRSTCPDDVTAPRHAHPLQRARARGRAHAPRGVRLLEERAHHGRRSRATSSPTSSRPRATARPSSASRRWWPPTTASPSRSSRAPRASRRSRCRARSRCTSAARSPRRSSRPSPRSSTRRTTPPSSRRSSGSERSWRRDRRAGPRRRPVPHREAPDAAWGSAPSGAPPSAPPGRRGATRRLTRPRPCGVGRGPRRGVLTPAVLAAARGGPPAWLWIVCGSAGRSSWGPEVWAAVDSFSRAALTNSTQTDPGSLSRLKQRRFRGTPSRFSTSAPPLLLRRDQRRRGSPHGTEDRRPRSFSKALGRSQGIVEKKSTMPIPPTSSSRRRRDQLIVSATDLDLAVSSEHSEGCEVLKEGALAVSARHLYEIVRALPEQQVTLKQAHNNYLEVRSGPSEFRIVGLPAEDFPALPRFEKVPFADVEAGGPARHDRADLLRRLDRRDPLQPERRLLRAVGGGAPPRRDRRPPPLARGAASGGHVRPEARRDPAEEGAPGAPQAPLRGGRVRRGEGRRRSSGSSRTARSSAVPA